MYYMYDETEYEYGECKQTGATIIYDAVTIEFVSAECRIIIYLFVRDIDKRGTNTFFPIYLMCRIEKKYKKENTEMMRLMSKQNWSRFMINKYYSCNFLAIWVMIFHSTAPALLITSRLSNKFSFIYLLCWGGWPGTTHKLIERSVSTEHRCVTAIIII